MMAIAKRALLPVIAGLLAAAASAEDMYKWVDADGHLHFGSTPPVGVKAQKMAPTATEPAASAPTPSWRQQLEMSNIRRQQQRQQEEQSTKKQRQLTQRCVAAQRELDVLNHGGAVYRVNAQGKRDYMSDEQRQAAIAAANQRVAAYCR
jgi:Domain of unknown function (DUF4124)